MNKKKIIVITVFVLLLAAGILVLQPAVTQETDIFIDDFNTEQGLMLDFDDEEEVPPYRGYIYAREIPEWVRPIRWFRSNAGGLAIEEMPSRFSALRNNYALAVDFAEREALPDELLPFYDDDCFIEVRMFYEHGIQIRTQWIFRDLQGEAKLVAAFSEQEERTGFIELYNDKGLLSVEYNFYEDNQRTRTDYVFNNGMLISASVHAFEENNGAADYVLAYADFFQYNRSMYLRAIERKYYKEDIINFSGEPVRFSLPASIKEAVDDVFFIGARYNTLPDFFGVVSVSKDFRMIYVTDERGRILTQTLYDEEDNVIWVITNTWKNDRIASTTKKEGDTVMTASYEYDSKGNRRQETNYKDGVLERLVRTEGLMEIEELYLNNVVVLRAVWEDGRKIQETRIRNN